MMDPHLTQSDIKIQVKEECEFDDLHENEVDTTTTSECINSEVVDIKREPIETESGLYTPVECADKSLPYQIKEEYFSEIEIQDMEIKTEEFDSTNISECIKSEEADVKYEPRELLEFPTIDCGKIWTTNDSEASSEPKLQEHLHLNDKDCTTNDCTSTYNSEIENTCKLEFPEKQVYDCDVDVSNCRTTWKSDIDTQVLVHMNPIETETYNCDICNYTTKYQKWLIKHTLTHLDTPLAVEKMYECEQCDYTTPWKRKLKHHYLVHTHASKAYICDKCEYQTEWKSRLKRHQSTHVDNSQIKIHKCPTCKFTTKYRGNLDRHVLLHLQPLEKKMYKCDMCDYTVEWKRRLKIHMLVHADTGQVDMHTCEQCEFKTKRKEMLTSHYVIHLDPSQLMVCQCSTPISDIPKNDIPAESSVFSENAHDYTEKYTDKTDTTRRAVCPFCFNDVSQFSRHLFNDHKENNQVKFIHSLKSRSKRRELLMALRKQAYFPLKTEKNIISPLKRSGTHTEYFPCTYCLGHYSKNSLYRHMKLCTNKPPEEFKSSSGYLTRSQTCMSTITSNNNYVLQPKLQLRIKREVFDTMRPDEVCNVAKDDLLICLYGEKLLNKQIQQIIFFVSNKVREMARLLIAIKQIDPGINNLFDILKPKKFQTIIQATKIVCGFDEGTKSFKTPSLVLHMGPNLKIVCDVAMRIIMEKWKFPSVKCDDPIVRSREILRLKTLIGAHWCEKLTNLALETISKRQSENPRRKQRLLNGMEPANVYIDTRSQNGGDSSIPEGTFTRTAKRMGNGYKIRRNKKTKIGHIRWSEAEKEEVRRFFSDHIEKKIVPKKRECEELISSSKDTFVNKDWVRVKTFVYNVFRAK